MTANRKEFWNVRRGDKADGGTPKQHLADFYVCAEIGRIVLIVSRNCDLSYRSELLATLIMQAIQQTRQEAINAHDRLVREREILFEFVSFVAKNPQQVGTVHYMANHVLSRLTAGEEKK